jgi:pentatricopeptide repeat protein
MTISVLGSCGEHLRAIDVLTDDGPCGQPPSAASYNAALAACGKAKDWKRALALYEHQIPADCISVLTTNALLTVLANNQQGLLSLSILKKIMDETDDSGVPPGTVVDHHHKIDAGTVHLVVSALVRSGNLAEAQTVLQDIRQNTNITIKDAVYDLLISAYSRKSDWNGIEQVENIRSGKFATAAAAAATTTTTTTTTSTSTVSVEEKYRFVHWEGLETKIGGNCWVVGNLVLPNNPSMNVTVGVHPNRNAAKNGIQLVFFETVHSGGDDSVTSKVRHKKLGFLLMQNSDHHSSLLGMFLKPTERGGGFAKYCLAIWIWFCLRASIRPVTGIIRKPLLALILQHSFGFVPVDSSSAEGEDAVNGVLVEVCRDADDPDAVILYSSSRKSLHGAFSSRELESQNIRLVPHAPSVRGRMVRIGCKLESPSDCAMLKETCNEILSSSSPSWNCNLSTKQIEQIFLRKF